MIQIKKLSKRYGNTVIFENTSFSFPEQGLVCVLGPSGCGKSTLLHLLAGFDSAYEGEISVLGKFLSQMNAEELCAYRRDNLGFVFQNYHLLSGYTALENVMLATEVTGEPYEKGKLRAKELLQKLGLAEKLDQKTETLSGGQKQRVAIARALVNSPSVILADEATGALDRKNSTEIMELLKKLSETRLVIFITHDKKCAEYADQIVTIEDGKLVSEKPLSNVSGSSSMKKRSAPKLSLWKRAFKNFRVHLGRSAAVALAISIGVLCFTLSLSSGNIMEQSIAEFEKKNTAYHNGYIKADGNEKDLLAFLEKEERIENCYAQYVLNNVSLKIEEEIVELEEKYPMAKAVEKMSYGVMPRRGKDEIALNPSLAAKFDRNIQNLIGKKVELTYGEQNYSLTVSGIFNATFDDYFVSSDIEQDMYKGLSGNVYSVSYDVKEFEEIPVVSESLKKQGLNSQNASIEVAAFLKTFQNLKRLFFIISVLIFVIGIFISAILLVKQQNTRYREVGLLSALGYTRADIRNIFLYENIGLSVLSALCSVALTAVGFVVSKIVNFSVLFTLPQILGSVCLTIILVLIISFTSSLRLVRTEPAEALRK